VGGETIRTWRDYVTPEARDALIRHGYDGDALPCGTTYDPPTRTWPYETWRGDRKVVLGVLRSHVCELDGIEVDGHEGSDLDPGSTACIHCDHEGPNP